MSTIRKTSRDYKEDLADLKARQKALEARIRNRCRELVNKYPDLSMGIIVNNTSEKELLTGDYKHINTYEMSTIFQLMEVVEAHLASMHPHKQTNIKEFDNIK
jgi:hypothetical protein